MKFKTKEDLCKNLEWSEHGTNDYPGGYTEGVDDAFESFAERVAFYDKYEGDMNKLFEEQKGIYVKYTEEWNKIKKFIFPNKLENILLFNHWLFKYCFGDVLE